MRPPTKTVIVIDDAMAPGLAANTAAVLALSLGHQHPELVGPAVHDGSGVEHPGITTVPLPVLRTDGEGLRALHEAARGRGVLAAAFSDVAQRTRSYEDYTAQLAATATAELAFLGVALHGPREHVESLTGSLPLFR